MLSRYVLGSIACVFALLCAPAEGRETIRVGGSGVGLGALRVLAKAYERKHPDRSVLVLPSIGSTGGIRAVIDGKLEVGCSARPLQPQEQVPGLAASAWATTAFGFATHAATAPEALTLGGIEDIYAGRRTAWKDGRPIRLVLRPKSDSSFAYLAGLTPRMREALDHAHSAPGAIVGITDQEALTFLEQTPGAFGTAALGLVVSERRQVRLLAVDGVKPAEPGYRFALDLLLVHRAGASASATGDFLAFVQSQEGRRILVRSGYRSSVSQSQGRKR